MVYAGYKYFYRASVDIPQEKTSETPRKEDPPSSSSEPKNKKQTNSSPGSSSIKKDAPQPSIPADSNTSASANTPAPDLTATPPSQPTPSTTGSCAAYPSFPDDSCTGPSGVLSAYTGDTTIKTAGTTIQNVTINATTITVSANNVTFRNCRIIYSGAVDATWTLINIASGVTGTVFDHCELDGQNKVARTISGGASVSVQNCNIHNTGNAVEVNRNVTVRDSYIWDIHTPAGLSWHSDGIQGWGDATNMTIYHNTILLTGNETGAVNFTGGSSQSNNSVRHNLFAGGGYTIYVGSPTSNTNVQVIDNHFSTRYHPRVGYFNIWYYDGTAPGVVRSGNVIHETGASADANLR